MEAPRKIITKYKSKKRLCNTDSKAKRLLYSLYDNRSTPIPKMIIELNINFPISLSITKKVLFSFKPDKSLNSSPEIIIATVTNTGIKKNITFIVDPFNFIK